MPILTHPHALAAVRLALASRWASRDYITHCINRGDCPRSLYVLACVLQAARAVDQSQPRGI
jgi:hypothetical protein